MASEVLIRKIAEFFKAEDVKIMKHNVRPWRSYEPIISWDGHKWFHSGDLFGYGFTADEVLVEISYRHINNATFQDFLGPERLTQLRQIINETPYE